jgi:hypothetical protein
LLAFFLISFWRLRWGLNPESPDKHTKKRKKKSLKISKKNQKIRNGKEYGIMANKTKRENFHSFTSKLKSCNFIHKLINQN